MTKIRPITTGITIGSLEIDVTSLHCGEWAAHPSADWSEHVGDPITGWAIIHEPSGAYVPPAIVDGLDQEEAELIILALAEADADPGDDWPVIQAIYAALHDPTPTPLPPLAELTEREVLRRAAALLIERGGSGHPMAAELLGTLAEAAADDYGLAASSLERLARWIGIGPDDPSVDSWATDRTRSEVAATMRGAAS